MITNANLKLYFLMAKRFPQAVAVTGKFISDASLAMWKLRQVEIVLMLMDEGARKARKESGELPAGSQKYAYLKGQADAHVMMAGLIRDRLAGKNWLDIIRSGRDKR